MQRIENKKPVLDPTITIEKRPGGKSSNKTLLLALKKILHLAKGKWVDELPRVLWAYRTTNRKPIEVLPFALMNGMEAIIPTKIRMPTVRVEIPEKANAEAIAKDLDTPGVPPGDSKTVAAS